MKKNNNIIREEDCPFVYEVTNTKNNSLELEKLKKETNLRYTLIITKGTIQDRLEYIYTLGRWTYVKFINYEEKHYLTKNVIKLNPIRLYKKDDKYCKCKFLDKNRKVLSGYNGILEYENGYKRFFWIDGKFDTYDKVTRE